MEPLNEKSQIAEEYGLLPADAQQQLTTRKIKYSSLALKKAMSKAEFLLVRELFFKNMYRFVQCTL